MFVKVKLHVQRDNTGNQIELPGLLTPGGLLTPLLDYCLAKELSRSISWMEKVVRSVQLFCEYMQANKEQRDTIQLFDNFANALVKGTFDPKTFDDPSDLCWWPRKSKDVSGILTDLSLFFDWLGENNPVAANINPMVAANPYEQRWNEAARRYRRENALLGHLWPKPGSDKRTRRVRIKGESTPAAAEPPAFPEDRFMDLINDGFRVGRRVDHRGICITLLLHGAGFRPSEPFHLYVHDAMPHPANPATALVRIHHPSDGYAPEDWKLPGNRGIANRATYLLALYGLKPRHKMVGDLRAGWKGGVYDADNYKQAHWFLPSYGELFLYHWNCYIEQLVHTRRDHPFLFVNLGRGDIGSMYKLPTFNDAHAKACRRIGLEPAKRLGTTPHGHRHAYGQLIRKAGLGESYIKMMLHHSSVESQKVYTQPGAKELAEEIRLAQERLELTLCRSAPLLVAEKGTLAE